MAVAAMETRRGERMGDGRDSQSGAEFGSGHGVWGARRRDDLLVGSMRARRQVGSGPKPNPLGADSGRPSKNFLTSSEDKMLSYFDAS